MTVDNFVEQLRILPANLANHLMITVIALTLGVMISLHYILPLHRWLDGSWKWLGLLPILISMAIAAVAHSQFRREGTTIKPHRTPTVLVTGGVFRISRNPMYLALVLILAGVGLLMGTATPFVVMPLFVWVITARVIRHEEALLTEQFGEPYARYKQEVRRWI